VVKDNAGDPRSYAEAMAYSDAAEQKIACEAEKCALRACGYTRWSRGRKVVRSRWVFRVKRGPNGAVQKHIARVVAHGSTSRRIRLRRDQMDVKSAYLSGELKEESFMTPTGAATLILGMHVTPTAGWISILARKVFR
jgi:hypothetical protein